MKTLLRLIAFLVLLVVLTGVVAYVDGKRQPVNHSTTVEGGIDAPPGKVFALILDYADGAKWRRNVKSVEVLPQESGHDHWIEHLPHGVNMNFTALETDPLSAVGSGRRVVLLQDPQYGGTWTYVVTPGSAPDKTNLTITEDGYINPPIYRFMMAHVMGMTRNLDEYMADLKAAAK